MLKNEKYGMFVAIRRLKGYFRIPKINNFNKHIKSKIIEITEELLDCETKTLADFVDLNDIMIQKFDNIEVDGNDLILYKKNKKYKLKIRSNVELIKNKISELAEISLQSLKDFEIIDFKKINELKNHIDNLIFALYFKIKIQKDEIDNSENVKNLCKKNKFYKIVSK